MKSENINSIINSLTSKEKEALKAVVSPIYFEDRSDYIKGLWGVVNALIGDKIDIDEFNATEWLYILEPDLNQKSEIESNDD